MSYKKLSEDKMGGEIVLGYMAGSIADSTIVMLALGGLSHQLHIPRLALAWWSCWLIVVICYALWDNGISSAVKLEYIARMMLRGERLK